jgi:hypothetical protein
MPAFAGLKVIGVEPYATFTRYSLHLPLHTSWARPTPNSGGLGG